MSDFKKGDRVYVTDEALAAMREIMWRATGEEPKPNHHGTVEYVHLGATNDEDYILINFDDGIGAPYSPEDVRLLEEESDAS